MSYKNTIKHILQHYNIGKLTQEPELLKGGFVNANYKIITEKGTYLFRELIKYSSIQHIEDVNNFLFTAKFPLARPQKTKDGKTYFYHKGRLFAIFEFKHGTQINVEKYLQAETKEEKSFGNVMKKEN